MDYRRVDFGLQTTEVTESRRQIVDTIPAQVMADITGWIDARLPVAAGEPA